MVGQVNTCPILLAFTVVLDGQIVKTQVAGNAVNIPLIGLSGGMRVVTVIADGSVTRFPLSWTELDTLLDAPITVVIEMAIDKAIESSGFRLSPTPL